MLVPKAISLGPIVPNARSPEVSVYCLSSVHLLDFGQCLLAYNYLNVLRSQSCLAATPLHHTFLPLGCGVPRCARNVSEKGRGSVRVRVGVGGGVRETKSD